MARYRHIDMNTRLLLLPVSLDAARVPGSFAHAVRHPMGELVRSRFDARYHNEVSAAACDPSS